MGFDSIWHWILLLVIVLVIFGTGKLTKMGPDLGNAVRGFKKAMQGDDKDDADKDAEKLKADPPEEETAAPEAKVREAADTAAPKAEAKAAEAADASESK